MIEASEIDRAIVSHSRWKARLREAIASASSDVSVATARSDHNCDFGKWLQALPSTTLGGVSSQQLRDLHSRFHREAAHVLELALARRKSEAEAAMASGSPFTTVSTDLVMALTQWKVDLSH